ncbi:COG4741 Predicted secreted endonuclease distantly related to archaeal Holliday junction resolvase [uncultured Caudovirales phage]|uniref:COG4741 Predicted secreted endonuclease distantly related to archaeal Holliday junction resolvase n=1 Tax=uncultured Caudovirales phage TaxID=2100421 RepID=A0A6J5KQA1_9CAUD|nr:COG4741 Predicted secreted endonuclease distantly related to archaeal Holliday junction resolvase [uncultured Caudovirales phage]
MIYVIVISLLVIGGLIYILEDVKTEVRNLQKQIEETAATHIIEKAKVKKDSTFRSSAVNWGKTIEHFVPFMTKFPIPAEDVVFLGMPIDYVGFTQTDSKTKCEVHFIEVKSGNAALMGKQRNIKRAIQEGRVHWHEIAVDGNRAEIIEE